jgi:radical SAM superfamily enzyme YgiQ (UPF0313 family)
MARIAFVQNLAIEYIGTMYLSAALKKHGHNTEVFIGVGNKRMINEIVGYRPDLVGFSCTTGLHRWCLKMAGDIKKLIPAKTIFGGPHPTFFPEIIKEEAVDIVCRGEGEGAIIDLADRMDNREDYTDTLNCWFCHNSRIIKNDVRPLLGDLDSLPFADRKIYAEKYPNLGTSQKVVFAGRGCPYSCSYCFNQKLREIYRGKGAYVRKRSVDNIIEEINLLRVAEDVKTIYFQDDTFFNDGHWLEEFAVKYKREVDIPYICLLRIESVDENSVRLLEESNCRKVFFGIESGSEDLRRNILNRRVTDEQIINGAGFLKKYGIRFRTYNMLGLPGETMEDAFKTVEINTRIGTDYPWCSLLYPYSGTALASYAQENNFISCEREEKPPVSFFKASVINSAHRKEMSNLQKLFFYAVKFPLLKRVIRPLIKIKPNILFDILFLASYGWICFRSEDYKISEVITKGLRNVFRFYFKPA